MSRLQAFCWSAWSPSCTSIFHRFHKCILILKASAKLLQKPFDRPFVKNNTDGFHNSSKFQECEVILMLHANEWEAVKGAEIHSEP